MKAQGNLAVFGETGWLSRESATFRQAWLAQGRIMAVARGGTIYREGDEGRSFYGILSGGIFAVIGPPRLAPRLVNIMPAGTWFGAGPVLSRGRRSIEFRAAEASRLLVVPGPAAAQMTAGSPEALRAVGALAMIGHDLATRVAAELLIPSSARRIAAILVRVAAPVGAEGRVPAEGIALAQSQLAEMANVSRNLANTALRDFRAAGWVESGYNRIRVTDRDALAAFAYGED